MHYLVIPHVYYLCVASTTVYHVSVTVLVQSTNTAINMY